MFKEERRWRVWAFGLPMAERVGGVEDTMFWWRLAPIWAQDVVLSTNALNGYLLHLVVIGCIARHDHVFPAYPPYISNPQVMTKLIKSQDDSHFFKQCRSTVS